MIFTKSLAYTILGTLYRRAYIHSYINLRTGAYICTQMLTYLDLPMSQLPKGFTLLPHEIGLN